MEKGGPGVGRLTTSDLVKVGPGLKVIPGANTLLVSLNRIVNWSRAGSIWPVTFGLA